MKRNIKGQEAIEFILICVLVFFGGLFAIMTFGSKMAAFFQTDSSFAQAANQKANVIGANTTPDFKTDLTTQVEDENRTNVIGYEAMKNPDGSVSVNINNQVVNLTAQDLDLVDKVFETTGSSGTELINAIARMIEIKGANSEGDVPLEISFGTGSRTALTETSSTYEGTASVNTTIVKSGDDIIIFQKDQTCDNSGGGACQLQGIYTIEGKMNSNNTFSSSSVKANITDGEFKDQTFSGSYNSTVKSGEGLSLSGNFNLNLSNSASYKWDIDFKTLKQL